jgi:DNA invertase Pin-like site-specific DNA recombinase
MRVSIAEARTGGHTLETQQARLIQKFDQIYGPGNWDLELRQDDGVSGGLGIRPTRVSRKIRPGFAECATLLETGNYDAFAVYNLSRLARDIVVMEQFLKEYVVATNTTFFSATEDIDLSTSQGWLYVRLMTAVNTSQREGMIERNRDAAAARVEQGYALGAASYGWQTEPRRTLAPGQRRGLVPIAEQGKWVIHIMNRYLSGWGVQKIVRELNQLGVPTPESVKDRRARPDIPAPRNAWNYSSVLKILFNPTHAGLVRKPRTGELFHASSSSTATTIPRCTRNCSSPRRAQSLPGHQHRARGHQFRFPVAAERPLDLRAL